MRKRKANRVQQQRGRAIILSARARRALVQEAGKGGITSRRALGIMKIPVSV